MKKIFSAVLVLVVLAILAGCGLPKAGLIRIEGWPENKEQPTLVAYGRTGVFGHDYQGIAHVQKKSVVQQASSSVSVTQKCDEKKIWERYEKIQKIKLEISGCKDFSLFNMERRTEGGDVLEELAECLCDARLHAEAIRYYEIAQRNYHRGKDTKNPRGKHLLFQVNKKLEKAKMRDLASCSVETKSVVQAPPVITEEFSITNLYSGGNSSVGNFALPALIGAGGYVAGQAVHRPDETNVNTNASGGTGTGGAGGSGMGIGTGAAAAAAASTSTSTTSGDGGSAGAGGSGSGAAAAGN